MSETQALMKALIEAVATCVIDHADVLTDLDQAIGDGDHGANMKRGFQEVLSKAEELSAKPLPDAIKAAGTTLVMKVGGASGPLYGTLLMTIGKELAGKDLDSDSVTAAFGAAITAVMARGKSQAGQKTMLDVLVPVHESMVAGNSDLASIRQLSDDAAKATIPMLATKGRASFLGERSIGHMDPGARSSSLIIGAVCDVLEKGS